MSLVRTFSLGFAAALAAGSLAHAQTTPDPDAPTQIGAPDPAESILPPSSVTPLGPPDASAKARPVLNEDITAVVNDDVITTYDLRQRMLLLIVTSGVQPTAENVSEIEKEALRGLVDEHLELQEIKTVEKKQKDLHLEPTAKEVDEEISGMASQNNVPSQQLLATLKSAGVEQDTLRQQIAVQMAWRHYMGGRFGSEIKIGDEQIAAAEARLMASAEKPQYLVSEIFLEAARSGGLAQAHSGAEQLIAQIKQGAPFAAVARQFSARPTAANGGDAGWLTSGEIEPGVENVLATMRPGQLSAPLDTPNGVYILLLRDKRLGAGTILVNLKQAAVRLAPDATPQEVSAAEAKLNAVKNEGHTCSEFDEAASRVSGVTSGDLGDTDVAELSTSFRQVVDNLRVGQIGGPVRSNAGLHLIALCGRRPAGPKTPTRDDLENRLYGEQLSMVARRFLRDLRNSATIESR